MKKRIILHILPILAVLVGLVGILVVCRGTTTQAAPSTTTTMNATASVSPQLTIPGGTEIQGLDLHDGTVVEDNGTYYLYGTEYACGYKWGDATTHWCGFGVASASSLTGPWSGITTLLHPSDIDPWSGRTWDAQCIRGNGGGCFNPRVVHNPTTGKWLLWFNAVGDNSYDHANAYNVYEMASPVGPLGTYNKPRSYTCAGCNGDFSIFTNGTIAYLVGTGADRHEYVEQLDNDWKNGTGNISGHGSGALFSDAEGPGIYRDPNTGMYIMTVSHPECGYCTGVRTIYATSSSPIGPWTAPQGAEASPHGGSINGPDGARSQVSGNTCGGQPRTVTVLDGQAYQFIDLWLGQQNETNANVLLEPLNFRNRPNVYGQPWSAFDPWDC